MPDTINRTRQATSARWQSALARALAQGVQVRQLQCGVWVANSGTDATGAYAVTLADCECRAAAEGDPVCKHRAALAHELGYLDCEPEPEPPAPAAPAANIIPFPSPAERERHEAATADKAIALIERMAALEGDAPCDLALAG